jgi:hypothetical protein
MSNFACDYIIESWRASLSYKKTLEVIQECYENDETVIKDLTTALYRYEARNRLALSNKALKSLIKAPEC